MGIRKSINGIAIVQKINIKITFVTMSAISSSVFGMATIVIISDQKADITLIQGWVPRCEILVHMYVTSDNQTRL